MPLYRYRAISLEGKIAKGEVDALNDFALEAQLKKIGLELIHAHPLGSSGRSVRKMKRCDLISFLFQLEMMLRAGVSVLSILADLRDAADTPEMKSLCAVLYEKIDAGSSISDAFATLPGVFPEITVNLVRSGEVTGQLVEVLHEIGRSLKWQDELEVKSKQLLLYPAFLTVVITAVVVFLMIYIVPQLVDFIVNMGEVVPIQTRALIWVSKLFVNYWWLILPAPPVLFFFVSILAKINPGVRYLLHAAALRFPYLGPVLKKIILARVSDTQGLTHRTGIPVLEGLDLCSKVSGNLVIKEAIEQASVRIANGAPISNGFASQQLFPALIIRMLKMAEETGDWSGAFDNISYFYNRDINESIGRVQAMIEPVLTIVLGSIIGWVILAVLGPIYDTISKIQF